MGAPADMVDTMASAAQDGFDSALADGATPGDAFEAAGDSVDEAFGGEGDMGESPDDMAAADPGMSDPAAADPGMSDPAAGDPAAADPGMSDPAAGDPAAADPGMSIQQPVILECRIQQPLILECPIQQQWIPVIH